MTFIINYNIVLKSGTITNKQIRVKNKENELIAKCSLEDYLRRKYGNDFIELIIIKCTQSFNNLLDFLNGIFK